MRRLAVCLPLLVAAGCFAPSFDSGMLQCAPGSGQCPPGYDCLDGHCWKHGERPTSSVGDDGFVGADDLSVALPDDAAAPVDMAMQLAVGEPCTSASDCLTGVCADKVCCDRACDGLCVACNQPGSVGSCTPIGRGKPSPAGHPGCTADPQTSCMHDGLCDGTGACELWPALTQCKPSSCNSMNQQVTPASTCDGQGTCVTPSAVPCAPYLCEDATQCWPSCNVAMEAQQCAPPNSCVNSSCGKKGIGAVCGSDAECLSGHCADGYCCNTACTGTCEACNLATTLGTCTPVKGKAAHGSCPGAGTTCGASCDGTNRTTCAYPPSGTGCNDGNACTYNDVCNGSGTCRGSTVSCPANTQCTTYSCNGTSTCTKVYKSNGVGCNDNNACTYSDVCNGAGTCAGTTVTCPTATVCTSYVCNGTSTCTPKYATQGTNCGYCYCGDRECDGQGTCVAIGCQAPKTICQ